MDIQSFDTRTEHITKAYQPKLTDLLRLQTSIDSDAAKIITLARIDKGGNTKVWLNGKERRLKDVRLVLRVEEVQ